MKERKPKGVTGERERERVVSGCVGFEHSEHEVGGRGEGILWM